MVHPRWRLSSLSSWTWEFHHRKGGGGGVSDVQFAREHTHAPSLSDAGSTLRANECTLGSKTRGAGDEERLFAGGKFT